MIKVLEVIPMVKSAFAPSRLSYFSTKNVARGDLVEINFRNKKTSAIVAKASELKEEKIELKKIKTFKLKPVNSVVKEKFLSEGWFEILKELSDNLFIPESLFLSHFISKNILSKSAQILHGSIPSRHQKIALRGTYEERTQYLRGIIRENFARKKSIIIAAPRIDSINKLHDELSKGIEDYIFSLSGELDVKKYLSIFNKAAKEAHPILMLGTYQVLFFDRPDLDTIIVEEEGSRLWNRSEIFPFDFRKIAEIIAEMKGLKLIWSDLILRAETIYKAEHGQIEARNLLTGRIQSEVEVKIIKVPKSESFSWITKQLAGDIEESLFRDESILLFVNRKGYSSFTICQDCSHTQLCPNCSTPMVLHKVAKDVARKFICHHCLKIEEVATLCQNCGSWRLKDLGLGIEKVEEEFKKLFPKAKGFWIATEAIFSQPDKKFDLVAVISLDYLLAIPDFRINEAIFRLVGELKSIAQKKFILQMRPGESKLLADAASGNISGFYQDEIKSREKFGYPPFKKLIKLTKEDRNLELLKSDEEKALSILKDYNPMLFPAFHEKLKNRYRWNILLKLDPAQWPDKNLSEKLHILKNVWQISVDPDSII